MNVDEASSAASRFLKSLEPHALYCVTHAQELVNPNLRSWHIKIGMSRTPEKRFAALASQTGYEIEPLALVWICDREMCRLAERYGHDRLREYRVRGEWFSCPVPMPFDPMEFLIDCACEGAGLMSATLEDEDTEEWPGWPGVFE